MSITRYRALILFVCFAIAPHLLFSQTKDSTKKAKLNYAGFYVIGGYEGISYYNNTYFNFVNELNSASLPEYIPQYQSSQNIPISPTVTGYMSTGAETRLGVGLLFNVNNNTGLYHVIEFSAAQNSGSYTYTESYLETANYGNSQLNIHDSTHATLVTNVFTLTYKIQPTYKNFFLSFGINCNFNVVAASAQTSETRKYAIFNTTTNQTTHYTTDTTMSNATQQLYVDFPLQLGVGARFKVSVLELEPAFYFTTGFMKGYNIYNISISIVKLRN